jgi:hypothetical protein
MNESSRSIAALAAAPTQAALSDRRASGGDLAWLGVLVHIWLSAARLFFGTFASFARGPHRFGAAWASGRMIPINPLLFLAASCPILPPIDYRLQGLLTTNKGPDVRLTAGSGRRWV